MLNARELSKEFQLVTDYNFECIFVKYHDLHNISRQWHKLTKHLRFVIDIQCSFISSGRVWYAGGSSYGGGGAEAATVSGSGGRTTCKTSGALNITEEELGGGFATLSPPLLLAPPPLPLRC